MNDFRDVKEPSSAPCRIRVRGLSKVYHTHLTPLALLANQLGFHCRAAREFVALTDVGFDVHAGELLGIVGRNGAGKSTLLQILAGTLQPTTGSVSIHGRVMALLELGSGFNPEFSGRANVYLNGAILGFGARELDARFESIAAFADIGDFIDEPVKTYSSGMFVRLAFAIQAMLDPDVLIVDEALSVGDIFFQQKCMQRLRELLGRGTCIVLVTHDLTTVSRVCDRALLLDHGHPVLLGPPKDVLERYIGLVNADAARDTAVPCATAREVPRELLPIGANAVRQGVGGVRLLAYDLRNAGGQRIAECVAGEDVAVEVECVVDDPALQPNIGVQFRDRFGNIACGTNAFMRNQPPPPTRTAGERLRVSFAIRVMLGEGAYTLTLAAVSYDAAGARLYDRADRIAELRVLADPRAGVSGFAYCPVDMSYSDSARGEEAAGGRLVCTARAPSIVPAVGAADPDRDLQAPRLERHASLS